MPRRDGTGPAGVGAMTGRGLGPCADAAEVRYGVGRGRGLGLGRGRKRGLGRGFAASRASAITEKELLQEERSILQGQLDAVNKQLEDL